jgi:hypothetical protein
VVLTLRRFLRPRRDDDRGVVAVVVALVVVFVVMPLLALVVDLGISRVESGRARTAADGAALAAALAAVSHPDAGSAGAAVVAAHGIAKDDFGVTEDQWADCRDAQPLPTAPSPGNCVSFDFAAKRVRVTLPAKQIPSVFSGIIGSSPPAASATSVATWGGLSGGCVLCVVGSYDGGAQRLEVHGGDVAVGGDLRVAIGALLLTDPGRAVTVGGSIVDVGGLNATPGRGGVPADPFATQLAALAALPEAAPSALAKPRPDDTGACRPGTYQDVSPCRSFEPGVYVLTGVPVPAPGRPTITLRGGGGGVMFYVTCNSGSYPNQVHPAACSQRTSLQPRVNFDAHDGPITVAGHPGYGGLALAFDPTAPSSSNTNQRFSGRGTLTLRGSIDGPAVVLRDPSVPNSGRLVVDGGRVVLRAVLYAAPPPVPPHPYVTVLAPPPDPLPDGPVRLVSSSP